MSNTVKKIKIVIDYFIKWKFRFSLIKIVTLYITTLSIVLAGWNFSISGHMSEKSNFLIDSWSISYEEYDLFTVLILVIVTIFFLLVLYFHDRTAIREQFLENEKKNE